MGGWAAGGEEREGAAAGVEEADPAAQQSQSGHGLGDPGSLPLPTAPQPGTRTADTWNTSQDRINAILAPSHWLLIQLRADLCL